MSRKPGDLPLHQPTNPDEGIRQENSMVHTKPSLSTL